MKRTRNPKDRPNVFARNLSQLIERERDRARKLPWYLKIMNPAIRFSGSVWFLWINVALFALWIAVNSGRLPIVKKFDPYPFEFLTLSVSLEAIVLSVVVLIAQNRLQNDSDERAHLDLHINLLAERETTLILKKLERIEQHFSIVVDATERRLVAELIEETDPCKIAEMIRSTMEVETV